MLLAQPASRLDPLRSKNAGAFWCPGFESMYTNKNSTPGGVLFLCNKLELAMIRARVRSGMEKARAKGRRIGRPQATAEDIPAVFLRHYPAYKAGKLNLSELARISG